MISKLSNSSLFRQQAFIAGKWCDSESGSRIPVTNPATAKLVGEVPSCSLKDVQRAIQAADQAQNQWRQKTAKERSSFLRTWFNLIIENREDLARIITIEQGKPLLESRVEANYAAAYVEWFAEEAKRAYGDIIPSNRRESRALVFKEPVGVVATITPWNFPAAMLARKIAPALAAGCAVVSKPSELTPFSALALAVLAEQAGLPAGLWNIVNGDPELIGAELSSEPVVKKISFTGSTRVGKLLMQQCASTVKKLSLELGGNAPFIVFASADIEEAIKGAVFAKFRNNGQTCISVNRFIVHDSVYDRFRDGLVAAIKKLKLGDGLEDGVEVGPLINQSAIMKVENQINDARNHGARICLGGKLDALGGTFFEPTVIDGATSAMLLAREETFGPLASLFRFTEESEAVALANNTESGLAGYFYSKDYAQIWRVAEKLEVGMLGVNDVAISAENIPFGGVKESGFGREGSKYGLDDYMQTKYICLGGLL